MGYRTNKIEQRACDNCRAATRNLIRKAIRSLGWVPRQSRIRNMNFVHKPDSKTSDKLQLGTWIADQLCTHEPHDSERLISSNYEHGDVGCDPEDRTSVGW